MQKVRWVVAGAASLACCAGLWGSDWLTDSYNSRRTNWQPNETILNKDNVIGIKLPGSCNWTTGPKRCTRSFRC